MTWVRRLFVGLLGTVLLLSLLGIAYSISFNRTFGTAQKVEKLLADSKIYDHLTNSLLAKSQDETNQGAGDSSVSFENQSVQDAAKQAFTPAELQKNVNTFIEANYAWLAGETAQPSFAIDLTGSKQNFAQIVGKSVTDRLAALPACTTEQQAQLQIPTDPLTVTCRPAGLDPTTEGARVTEQINSGNFLSQSVIKPETVGQDQNSQQDPYYKQFASAPKLFQIGQKAPWILSVLALLCALGVVFISFTRRSGLRKVGFILVTAGVLLIATKLIADLFMHRLESKLLAASGTVTNELDPVRDNVLRQIESQLTQTNIICGVIFLILAGIILGYLIGTRKRDKKPKTPVKENGIQDREEPDLVPSPRPEGARLPADAQERLRPQGPPEIHERPRRPKPPRLIQ